MSALVVALVGCGSVLAEDDGGPLVDTPLGPVLGGWMKSEAGAQYASFEGIPFSAPPVGKLRFGAPQPVEPWTETLNASGRVLVKCTQYGYMSAGGNPEISGSEDCLYLNVYAPKNSKREPKAVMMWIYGGSLTAGSNQFQEYGPMRFIDQDVIIVSPNYRLGSLGFTSLGIDEAPGNQGFMDCVAALEWINLNIESFGGDPGRVTIFGESSGSWIVSYLNLSPMAKGLYQRAIMQSGGLFNPYWTPRTEADGVEMSTLMTTVFNCTTSPKVDPYAALDCLQNLPREMIQSSGDWGDDETYQIQKILRPTGIIGREFLPENPVDMMAKGDYNHIDLMVGMTKDEGLLQTYQLELNPQLYLGVQFTYKIFGPMFLFGRFGSYDITEQDLAMADEITKYYLGDKNFLGVFPFDADHFDNITAMIGDAYIYYGGHKQAEWAAAHGDNVYQYKFSFKGTYGFANVFGLDNSQYGVCHADELYYYWKPYWNKALLQMPEREDLLSRRLLTSWANFAKFGDPSIPEDNISWDQLSADNHVYMNIDDDWGMELSQDYLDRMAMWDIAYEFPTGNTLPPSPGLKVGAGKEKFWTRPRPQL